jgi:hypothetical protein
LPLHRQGRFFDCVAAAQNMNGQKSPSPFRLRKDFFGRRLYNPGKSVSNRC